MYATYRRTTIKNIKQSKMYRRLPVCHFGTINLNQNNTSTTQWRNNKTPNIINIRNHHGNNIVNNAMTKRHKSSNTTKDHDHFNFSFTGSFTQEKPKLKNQFHEDRVLKSYLKRTLPKEVYSDIEADLVTFGERVSTEVLRHHEEVGNYEPTLQQYDGWGERIDRIHYHPSWRKLHDIAAEEKLIKIPYENKYGVWSRVYQFAKLYMFHPSSGLSWCPFAMTDGASTILKNHNMKNPFKKAYERLTTSEADKFWTAGQWMTEKKGGSDVGNGTETYAIRQEDGTFKLHGYKWFTSAVDADIAMTLARIVDENGKVVEGTKGLTMFYLETRHQDGSLNGLRIEKLKKKLGTRQMPTAELLLDGAEAHQLSEQGRGIASISPMLTVSRIHNAISATSTMRRLLNLSKDYARKRIAFGQLLKDNPLHIQTLARQEVEQQGAFHLMAKVCVLFGRLENGVASDQEKLLLRILTPLLKLYTGKQAVQVSSELLESFGGHGYLEDTGLPVYLRDAQVLSIWEGTTNVLSMDVLRCIGNTNGEVLEALLVDCNSMLTVDSNDKKLQQCSNTINQSANKLGDFMVKFAKEGKQFQEVAARDYSYSLVRLYIASLLYENAVLNPTDEDASQVAFRWICMQDLVPVYRGMSENMYSNDAIVHGQSIVYPTE